MSQFKIMGGLRHRIENCTVNFVTSFGCDATASEEGHVIRNNTFTQGLSIPKASTVTGNNVTGNVTIGANNATVSGTTVYLGSTITGNSILGKVTFSNNSKNNTFTGNTVISSDAYAVVMATTADANNTVTDNILLAASNAGDAAVNPSTGTGNTISNNLAEAATAEATWNFDAATGTLTIGGTGAMADYEQTSGGQTTAPWAFLSDKITRVIIGDGVTKVGNNAFQGCTALNDVFVKGTGTLTIGTAAFDATKTPAIYVPTGQEAAYQTAWSAYAGSISGYMSCGDNVMAVYDAATKTLTICGKGAMTDLSSADDQPWKSLDIQTVVIEKSITAVGQNAFANCSALTAARIEGTATTIADGAFTGNATGRKIFVPIAAVGNYASTYASTYAADLYSTGNCGAVGSEESVSWEYSNSTKSLTISGTGAMMDYASTSSRGWHSQAASITSVVVEAGVTSIGNYAFYDCSNLATVTFAAGSNLTSIGNYAFQNCSSASFTSINIPASVTSIGESAFRACSNLSSIEIPASVTSIGNYAFRACSNLSSIEIPASVTSIGNNAFYYCSNLTEVNIFAVSLTTYGSNAFQNTPDGLKIYVPAISLEEYKTKWSAYADKFAALPYYALTMKEGTQDADKWTVKAGTDGSFQSLPLEGVKAGTKVKLKYDGDRSMLKGVKAEKKGGAADNTYQKWDADQKKLVATEIPTTAIKVESASTDVEWQGTYVVEGQVTIGGIITLNGDVDLIIKDGATLTANKIIGNSNKLYIYGQSGMTGELVVNCTNGDAIRELSTLEVHSAKVTATSSVNASGGIGEIGTFNVYGGSVEAKGTVATTYGIDLPMGSSMNIYGGEVKAEGTGDGDFWGYGIVNDFSISKAPVTIYGGKLWAGNANNKALKAVNLLKGDGFTGKIEYSSDNSTWSETPDADAKYVRAGY